MSADLALRGNLRERLLCGETEALAELFALHRERLWKIVYFRLDPRISARVDPDDVLQDAFLDASLRLSHYPKQRVYSPFVWLRLIVRQTLVDVHRRHLMAQQRDASREIKATTGSIPRDSSVSMTACLLGHTTSPSEELMRSEKGEKLRSALKRLGPTDQEVLALRHFEELTNKEVSEYLGISPKTASIRYVRALSRLKEVLSESVNHPGKLGIIPDRRLTESNG